MKNGVIRCEGDGGMCGSTAATVEDGHLVIRSKHHGRRHETRVPLAAIESARRIEEATKP